VCCAVSAQTDSTSVVFFPIYYEMRTNSQKFKSLSLPFILKRLLKTPQ